MIAGQPIYEHGLTEEMLEDLHKLRLLRIELVENQLKDLEQTKSDLDVRELFASEKLEMSALKEALEEKRVFLQNRLDEPKAIYTDEIQFFLEIAN